VARVSPESEARRGDTVKLVVDSSKVHLFDPETEEAILHKEASGNAGQEGRPIRVEASDHEEEEEDRG
jgi:protein required for attachment to host cells